MQLSDEEIKRIIINKRKAKLRKKRAIRRLFLIILAIIIVIVGIGVFVNRDAMSTTRGTIFIDPAHGGVDAGSTFGKRYEKDDTLKFAIAVRDELKDLGFKVYLSREDDIDLDVAERGAMANEKDADLMVSIHRNKAEEGSGVEIYIPASNDEASRLLGNNIYKALKKQGFDGRDVRTGAVFNPKEDYIENSSSNMPSCLIELGFLQNKHDNELFDNNIKENAAAFATAISDTFATLYEPAD